MARNSEYTDKINKAVGANVWELRLANGMSRQQLGKKVGVTHQQIQKYEKGTNKISSGRLAALAKALKKPVSYFFGEPNFDPESPRTRLCMEMTRNFMKIESEAQQVVVNQLVRVLAEK